MELDYELLYLYTLLHYNYQNIAERCLFLSYCILYRECHGSEKDVVSSSGHWSSTLMSPVV